MIPESHTNHTSQSSAEHSRLADDTSADTSGTDRRPDPERVEIARANAGEHALIHQLLLAVYQSPSRDEFQAANEDPFYEPADRLLIKLDDRIVSHVHLTKRVMKFGHVQLPIAEVRHLTTLPEYRREGYASAVLDAADQQMLDDGAVISVLRTRTPELFENLGWFVSSRPRVVAADARKILAELSDLPSHGEGAPLSTRMWRHVELRPLMELYEQHTAGAFGPLARSELYWRWLIGRKGYEQFIVAIEGEDTLEYGEQAPRIVGYAVTKHDQLVELVVHPERGEAASHLLARMCRESIERATSEVRVYLPPGDTLPGPLAESAELWREVCCRSGEVGMIKVLDAAELVRRLYPELLERSRAAGVNRPLEITFGLPDEQLRLTLTRRSVRLESESRSRSQDVLCNEETLHRLLTSQLDLADAVDGGEIRFSKKRTQKTLAALFPFIPLWRPTFDDLQA